MGRPVRKWFVSSGVSNLRKRIRPFGCAVGQDGDPRILILIKGPASSAIFRQGFQNADRLSGLSTTRRHRRSPRERGDQLVLIRRVKPSKRMLGDKAYDSAELRDELDERNKAGHPQPQQQKAAVQLQQASL
jgi:hypothetical protein